MGMDPERIFDIVYEANMGKVFLMEKLILTSYTQILKPMTGKCSEPAIRQELQRQFKAMSDIKKEK